jgi:hypothetical protein
MRHFLSTVHASNQARIPLWRQAILNRTVEDVAPSLGAPDGVIDCRVDAVVFVALALLVRVDMDITV